MNDESELPGSLLDLAGRKNFSELDASEISLVQRFMNAGQYDALHEASCAAYVNARHSLRRRQLKDELAAAFDSHHNVAPKRDLRLVWSAAALLLVVLTVIGFRQVMERLDVRPHVLTVHDTVFVDSPAVPEVIHDTVYRHAERRVAGGDRTETVSQAQAPAPPVGSLNDLGVVTFADFSNEENSVKGNSLKDDSLALNFEFVQL